MLKYRAQLQSGNAESNIDRDWAFERNRLQRDGAGRPAARGRNRSITSATISLQRSNSRRGSSNSASHASDGIYDRDRRPTESFSTKLARSGHWDG